MPDQSPHSEQEGPLFPVEPCTTCGEECMCGDQERVIRRIIRGDWPHGPMTARQREWCVQEADSAGEGMFHRRGLELLSDIDLAQAVMEAWRNYVQSNC